MNQLRVVFSGGGTGGHIYPAIAIAKAIQSRVPDAKIKFVGAIGKMEMEKVPQEGYEILGLPIAGFQRKMTVKNLILNLILPFKLMLSMIKTFFFLFSFKPNIVVGTGGYASGPTLKMAHWMGIPTAIQEQNSIPGYTNRILAQAASAIFVAFEDMQSYFGSHKVYNVGNAIRETFASEIMKRSDAASLLGLDSSKPIVFVTGGSLGALAINQAIETNISLFDQHGIQLYWQCGKIYLNQYAKYQSDTVKVVDFVKNMNAAYSASDVIVSRAGGTIFELFVVGKPTILLPSPNVAEDHQTANARAIEKSRAAIMIRDVDANEQLVPAIVELVHDEEKKAMLSSQIKLLAKPYAASAIAEKLLEIIKEKNKEG
jgi:UDP-N-acetylglucosamine--N-acetylmuramyl-(pentapeptide) pyrophosphoryl-undecaprenol N-acetylglucosamine transferase